MEFCEGSPTDPAYGTGHATVTGGVYLSEKVFNHQHPLTMEGRDSEAFVPTEDG